MAETPEQEAPAVLSVADSMVFSEYLCRVVPVLLEDRESASAGLKTALVEKNHLESIKKFLSDPQIPVLFVQRSSTKGVLFDFMKI